jgi:rhodanese-related sulfurtransferase
MGSGCRSVALTLLTWCAGTVAVGCEDVAARPDLRTQLAGLVAAIPRSSHYGTVTAARLARELAESRPFLVDLREPEESDADGYVDGSVNIPLGRLIADLDRLPARDRPIVVYCSSGHRGAMAMTALRLLGYTSVRNLAFGFDAWWKAGFASVEGPRPPGAVHGLSSVPETQVLRQVLGETLGHLPGDFHATTVATLHDELSGGRRLVLLDVRRAEQYERDGRIAGAVSVPLEVLFDGLPRLPSKDTRIVVCCVSGHRSSVAATGLRLLGYVNVASLDGGLEAWKAAGLPLIGGLSGGTQ